MLILRQYAAVASCTNHEARRRFGESREVLLQRYGRVIESALADNYNMPVLESLQALVIYVVCLLSFIEVQASNSLKPDIYQTR